MLYDFSRISGLNPDKLTRNAICSVHSIAACALSFSYIKLNLPHNIAYNFSTTYFIWDSIITIINKENKVFILHHIIAIYTLSFEMEFIYFLLFISELSNFWNYIVYYYLHIDSSPRVDVAMAIQLLWYWYFRVGLFSKFAESDDVRDLLWSRSWILYYNVLTIYLLGVYWAFVLAYRFIKKNPKISPAFGFFVLFINIGPIQQYAPFKIIDSIRLTSSNI
tara:strand:- start:1768 stop:2430 length:663 start_codon:yes stop_codon:yes gene_type:complete